MEAPNQRRQTRSLGPPRIECPQCKSDIKLSRPRNLVVEAVRGMERLGSQLVTPGALTVLFGTVYNSSMAWGVHSIYAVFGSEDGFRILRPLILNTVRPPIEFENGTAREIGEKMLAVALDHLVHWRLYVGLPLITPILILSRTSLADSVLPILPILFFATQTHSPDDSLDFGHWPPSASLAFAVLPYVRTAYNMYYRKVWAEKEKLWLKQIQPRQTQAQNDGAGNEGNANQAPDVQDRDDGNVFEVRIDGGIWEDWEDDEEDEAQVQEQEENQMPNNAPAAPPPQPQQEDGQADPPPNINDNRAANQQQPANAPPQQDQQNRPQPVAGGGGERRVSFSPTAIAETVLGALIFPALAGMSGELLKLALPRAWTTPPATAGKVGGGVRVAAKGLLQEKWGRSLVGGCLFVVLKDAVVLYVRWKMARMHRLRKVVDYDREKGTKKAEAGGGGLFSFSQAVARGMGIRDQAA